jgi:hypothetical protein
LLGAIQHTEGGIAQIEMADPSNGPPFCHFPTQKVRLAAKLKMMQNTLINLEYFAWRDPQKKLRENFPG